MQNLFESNLVRYVFIPLYIIIAGFTIFLLWKNSASNNSLQNSGIILASLLPTLIAVLPYLNSPVSSKTFTYQLFYNIQSKKITDEGFSALGKEAYAELFEGINDGSRTAENVTLAMNGYGPNLIENAILQKLLIEFHSAWNLEKTKFSLPNGRSWSFEFSDSPGVKISSERLLQIFHENGITLLPNVLLRDGITLPPKTTIKAKAIQHVKTISIENDKMLLEILIAPLGGVVDGTDGLNIPGLFDSKNDPYYIIPYGVTLKMKQKRFEKHSPDMPAYLRWFENIGTLLESMDWERLEHLASESLKNEAAKKTLDI